ncbi:hypothetical protein PoB_001652000, partial [Plakobranchus ocellatus]
PIINDDLLALDCVQTCTPLVVKSVVSSVLCLQCEVSSHPGFYAISGSNGRHFIFVSDHQLRLCRIKILEQISKKEGRLQMFTRTDHQAVIFVQFLHSILPEDVTFIPYLPTVPHSIQQAGSILKQELQHKIANITAQLQQAEVNRITDTAIHVEVGNVGDCIEGSSISPTFHSKKAAVQKARGSGSMTAEVGKQAKTKSENGSSIERERKKFLTTKRKMRERFEVNEDI